MNWDILLVQNTCMLLRAVILGRVNATFENGKGLVSISSPKWKIGITPKDTTTIRQQREYLELHFLCLFVCVCVCV